MTSPALVIGSSVDALVAAHYLKRAGHQVTIVSSRSEARDDTPEIGWVPERIVRDLALARSELEVVRADPWAITVVDGARLELTRDVRASAAAIGRFSVRDAGRWPAFCERMQVLARVLAELYAAPPPDPLTQSLRGFARLAHAGLAVRRSGRESLHHFLRLLPMSVADYLDDCFESGVIKGVLGAAGVMHLCQGARSGGTALNLLHQHVGSPCGVFRAPLSNLRTVLSGLGGIATRTGSVAGIEVQNGRATGVVMDDGSQLASPLIVSGETPAHTLLELADAKWLDPELVRAIRNIRSRGVSARVALTLDRAPGFTTLVIAPSLDYLERAYDAAKYFEVSENPLIEARNLGKSSGGGWRVVLHVQYVPYVGSGAQWNSEQRDAFLARVVSRIARDVPGFDRWVVDRMLLTPHDQEERYGFPQGQAYHAELALDQFLWMRPLPELAQYRTPIGGLYLCGPAMHPGAGISGAAGAHCASRAISDARHRG